MDKNDTSEQPKVVVGYYPTSKSSKKYSQILAVLLILVIGGIGTRALTASHADPLTNSVSIASFGAVGNGSTDDTVALQKALTTVSPNTTIQLETGKTYRFTSALKIKVAGTHLNGNATLLATNQQSSGVIIAANDVTVDGNLTLKTINVTQRWSAPDQNGITIDHVQNAVIKNITVDGSGAAGVFAYGASHYLIQDVTVQNTHADAIHNTTGSSFGSIIRPIIRNCGDDGVAVVSYKADGAPSHDITVESPKFYGNTNGRAYSVVGGYNVKFTNIYAENSNAATVYIGSEGNPYFTYGVSNVTVSGGTIVNANQGAPDHGAILLLAGETGIADESILIENLTITNTRPTVSRQISIINYGGTFSKLTLRHINLNGGGNVFGTNDPNPAVYNSLDWKKNGVVIADHTGFTPLLPETVITPPTTPPVTPPVTTPPQTADLVVTNITTVPAQPVAGQAVSFTAVLNNQGNAATGNAAVDVAFKVDGQPVSTGSSSSSGLAAGTTTTVSGTTAWPATAGNHAVTAQADSLSRITESNETNNTFSKSVTITSPTPPTPTPPATKPDFIVTGITMSPSNPVAGSPVTYTATLKNIGAPKTDGTIIGMAFYVDGVKTNWGINSSTLATNASLAITATSSDAFPGRSYWTTLVGSHTVLASVDDVQRISESNETNNTLSKTFNVSTPTAPPAAPRPDVVVTSISANPSNLRDGQRTVLSAVIKNRGTAPTPGGALTGISFSVDGKKNNWAITYRQLAPGESMTLTAANSDSQPGMYFWTAIKGTHKIQAYVDDLNRYAESNDSNNARTTTLTVAN